jgi:ribosome-associated heat shock protein Hsp15
MSYRFDKYVWSVRLSKTRSKAADAISKGRVRLNNEHVKPAKEVKLGDEIQITKNNATFSFKVIDLLDRRVGAKLVPNYLIDITPEEEVEKYKQFQLNQRNYRDFGDGKPTKKQRRDLDDFLENW